MLSNTLEDVLAQAPNGADLADSSSELDDELGVGKLVKAIAITVAVVCGASC